MYYFTNLVTNYIPDIIKMIFLVDCTWTTWMYGECSATCGEGTVAKTRSMNMEMFGGLPCEGSPVESESCNERDCPTGKMQ